METTSSKSLKKGLLDKQNNTDETRSTGSSKLSLTSGALFSDSEASSSQYRKSSLGIESVEPVSVSSYCGCWGKK